MTTKPLAGLTAAAAVLAMGSAALAQAPAAAPAAAAQPQVTHGPAIPYRSPAPPWAAASTRGCSRSSSR